MIDAESKIALLLLRTLLSLSTSSIVRSGICGYESKYVSFMMLEHNNISIHSKYLLGSRMLHVQR